VNTCAGCLGEGSCWVCLGAGRLPSRQGKRSVCHACGGSARCAQCSGTAPMRVTTIDVERQVLCSAS